MSDQRRQLAHRVLSDGASVAQVARVFGVSRQTAHFWVSRARKLGALSELEATSRRPHTSPNECSKQVLEQVLCLAIGRPTWGGRKIHSVLWPDGQAPVCARTVERIVARAIGIQKPADPELTVGRFERQSCHQLWQADFKGMGLNPPKFRVLSVIDDRSRLLIDLRIV